jgi:hypothetical protein
MAAGQTVALEFATIAAANNYWLDVWRWDAIGSALVTAGQFEAGHRVDERFR